MIDQAVLFETGQTYASDAVVLAVIVAALLLQRGGAVERARLTGVAAWAGQREVRPIPRELRRLPEIKVGVPVLAVIGAALLLFLPLTWNASRVNLFTGGVIVAVIFLSLLIITGFAGQISLGQLAIVSFSSAVAGSMSQNGNNLFATILVAGLVGRLVSVLLGIPALRMTGPFFAVTSLAFAVATGTFFLNPEYFRWLRPEENVRVLRPVIFDKFDLESDWSFYYFVLVFFVLAVAAAARIRSSRTGRAIVANRENTRAAQGYGINAKNAGLTAFGLAGFIAGIAGALNVYYLHGLSVSYLNAETGILVFAIAIVGGLGSVPGALIGAAYLTFLENSPFTASPLSQLFMSGIGVLFILMVLPSGLGGLAYDLRDNALRRIARRRGVVVPSLLADLRVDEDGVPFDADRARAAVRPPDRRAPSAGGGAQGARRAPSTPCTRSRPTPRAPDRCSPSATSSSPTGRRRSCSGWTATSTAMRSSPCSAPTARASPRCSRRSPASPGRARAASCSTATRSPGSAPPRRSPKAWCSCPAARACSPR